MKLSEKIWKTRKSRINAADRLGNLDFYSQLLITIYSTVIVLTSILTLNSEFPDLSILIICLSIMILVLSLFIGTRGFKERAISHKNCYVRLNKLIIRAECLEKKTDENCDEGFESIQEDYDEILLLFENHKKIDYLKTMVNAGEKLSATDFIYLWGHKIGSIFLIAFMLGLPMLIYFFFVQ